MITNDQFTNIPTDLLVAFSSASDGTVLDRAAGVHDPRSVANRVTICKQLSIRYEDTVYQLIIYDTSGTYTLIADVDSRSTSRNTSEVVADALFTRTPGVALFLPVADCIVTTVYDPKKRMLAQAHMGRHSTVANLMGEVIDLFSLHGSETSDLLVWMGPAATKASYRLDYFEQKHDPMWHGFYEERNGGYYLDMQGFNRQVLLRCGVLPESITISPIDTYENPEYFSHSRGDTHGRFAGIAMMR